MIISLSLQVCDETVGSPSVSTCKAIQLTEEEKKEDDLGLIPDSCCFGKSKGVDGACVAIKKDKVSSYIDEIKKEGVKGVSIDCSGKFLSLASGVLVLLLLA